MRIFDNPFLSKARKTRKSSLKKEEKPLNRGDRLIDYISQRLQDMSADEELKEAMLKLYRILQERGYTYGKLKQIELQLVKEFSQEDHPEHRKGWTNIVPLLRAIVDEAEAEGRELP
jgi:hypothetical protein